MICSWRWFIHPATAIRTNRNGSRTLGISLAYYREPNVHGDEAARIQADPVSGLRVGIEGRISVLLRGRGMKRCLAKGRERFEVLVGAAVLVNNLMRIAALLGNRKPQ